MHYVFIPVFISSLAHILTPFSKCFPSKRRPESPLEKTQNPNVALDIEQTQQTVCYAPVCMYTNALQALFI